MEAPLKVVVLWSVAFAGILFGVGVILCNTIPEAFQGATCHALIQRTRGLLQALHGTFGAH